MMKHASFFVLLFLTVCPPSFAQQLGWKKLDAPYSYFHRRIYLSGNEAWLLDNGDTIFYSSNYPLVPFSPIYVPSVTGLIEMVFMTQNGNNYGWAVGSNSLGAKSNNGTTWTSMSLGGTCSYRAVSFPTSSIGFASGTDKRLHKTINGGNNWVDVGVTLGFSTVTSLVFTDSLVGYVATADPRLAKTVNGGLTWNDENADFSDGLEDIFFYDNNHGWVVGVNDILIYNNGTWTCVENNTGHTLNSVFFINPSEGWIVGNNGTILHSIDGGFNWTSQNCPTTAHLLDVFFTSSTNGFAVGYEGTILQFTNIETEINETNDIEDLIISPNPTSGIIKLDFKEQNTINRIDVFDLQGKNILTTYPSTDHYIDLSLLNNGLYILHIETSKHIYNQKIVKSH